MRAVLALAGKAARRLIAAALTWLRRKPTIDESKTSHIFRLADGHLPVDTRGNRRLLLRVAGDPGSRLGTDRFGVIWAAQTMPDGRQVWVQVWRGRIVNGGVNSTPRSFNPLTASPLKSEKRMTADNKLLTEKQAFRAMSQFLEQYYERAGRNAELALVLSDMQMLPDGRTADPAAWEDWLNAVRIVLEEADG